ADATKPEGKATTAGQPPMPAAADPEAAKKAAEQQKKQEHLQKIQQLQFDRRPSTILKMWSSPPGTTLEELQRLQSGQPEPEQPAQPMAQPQEQPPPAPDPFDDQLKQFQRNVIL